MLETYYVAKVPLLIPQGPGKKPSALYVAKGGIFALDGDEPINVPMLLQNQQITVYTKPEPEKKVRSKGVKANAE